MLLQGQQSQPLSVFVFMYLTSPTDAPQVPHIGFSQVGFSVKLEINRSGESFPSPAVATEGPDPIPCGKVVRIAENTR